MTDSNISYPHVLNGCSAVKCPFEIFTSIYQPQFPGNVDIECAGTTAPSSKCSDRLSIEFIRFFQVVTMEVIRS